MKIDEITNEIPTNISPIPGSSPTTDIADNIPNTITASPSTNVNIFPIKDITKLENLYNNLTGKNINFIKALIIFITNSNLL